MNPSVPNETPTFYRTLSTPFGPVVVFWSPHQEEAKVVRILLSTPDRRGQDRAHGFAPGAAPGSCREIDALCGDMAAFFGGAAVNFDLNAVRLDRCPPFQAAVLRTEHAIPRGSVGTYKAIAHAVGRPRGFRAVGNALASNPFPIIIPCHRAVRSDGTLGGYQGGPAMKRTLLEMEGIGFDEKGRVAHGPFFFPGRGDDAGRKGSGGMMIRL